MDISCTALYQLHVSCSLFSVDRLTETLDRNMFKVECKSTKNVHVRTLFYVPTGST